MDKLKLIKTYSEKGIENITLSISFQETIPNHAIIKVDGEDRKIESPNLQELMMIVFEYCQNL